MPDTTPPEDTVAPAGLPLLHVAPGVAELRVVVVLWHMLREPVITAGSAFIVSMAVEIQPEL